MILKRNIGLTLLFIVLITAGIIVYGKVRTDIILFYGDGCPHCEIVDQYMKDNGVEDKLKNQNLNFSRREVYNNQANQRVLANKAKSCGLATESIGVPFLWDGTSGKCVSGDQPIIDFFKSK